MSRSGYSEDLDILDLGRWRGRVASAVRGKRGQRFLRDLLAALDAMPEKALIAGALADQDGDVCTLGCALRARGVDMTGLDMEDDAEVVARALDIAEPLAKEVAFENEEAFGNSESPEHRWQRMRRWVVSQLKPPPPNDREAAQ